MLDLDAFERCNKAEGLGMSDGASALVKNLHDAEFICELFRFLQLLCEGHNLGKVFSENIKKNLYHFKLVASTSPNLSNVDV